jgi:hypothetical protein
MLAKLHTVERDASNQLHFVAPRKMAHGYFAGFDDFDHDPDRPLIEEFRRLAINRQWVEEGKLYRKECQKCFAQEFGLHFNHGQSHLSGWQDLCKDLSIEPVPGSITKCKRVSLCGRLLLDSTADINRRYRKNMSTLLILLSSEDVVCLRNCSHQRELFVDTPSKKGRSSASKRLRVTGIWLCY